MESLLKITSIPMQYELKIQHARLERGQSSPPVIEITRQKGGLRIENQPACLNIDTYEARNSVVPTVKTAISQSAEKGLEAAWKATSNYAREAAQMRWSKPGEGAEMLHQIFMQRAQLPTGEFQLAFIPSTGASITYQSGDLQMDYQMDRLVFNLKCNNGDTSFVPGSIEMEITQYADVKIEYMGSPVYVPPSAAERFTGESVDLIA